MMLDPKRKKTQLSSLYWEVAWTTTTNISTFRTEDASSNQGNTFTKENDAETQSPFDPDNWT